MMWKIFRQIFSFILVVALFVVLPIWHLNREGYFTLTHIEFLMLDQEKASPHLVKLINGMDQKLESFRGKSLFEVDIKKMGQQISGEKWIKDFEIYREWPNQLKVFIKTYDVTMLYWNEKNEVMPILENNEMLEPISKKEIPDRVYVFDPHIAHKTELRKKAIATIQSLPSTGPLQSREISEIGYDPRDGFWLHVVKKDLIVKLGEEKTKIKAQRVSQVIDYVDNHQINARVIDANLSQKVLVRLRKDP